MEPINLLNIRRGVVSLLLLSVSILIGTGISEAAIQCYDCHGTSSNFDYRPVDAAARNYSTGGVVGNHRTHMAFPAGPAECSKCHSNSGYNADHRDSQIQLSANINTSPAPGGGQYRIVGSPVTFKNHTSVPVLGTCSNVNCHFEAATPVWGSATFTYTSPTVNDCDQCHGAPPGGGLTGAAGSHAKHDAYYSGADNCAKCHSDHIAESGKFSHATSAGRNLNISFAAAPNNGVGAYSGALNDYLPSQNLTGTAGFGDCSNLYCHSPGIKLTTPFTPKQVARWGETLGCGGCHDSTPNTGSHTKHVVTTYGVPVPCYKCHSATVSSNMAISTANHVNGYVTIAFGSSTTAINGKYSSHATPYQKKPGSGYGNCDQVYCHSNGQNNGGTSPPTYSSPKWFVPGTGKCGSCHNHGYHNTNGATSQITSGSHKKHLDSGLGLATADSTICVVCHYGSGTAAPSCSRCHTGGDASQKFHVDGKIDVSFVTKYPGTYNGSGKPGNNYSGSTCTVSCHYNTEIQWGAALSLNCFGCHTLAKMGGAHAKHIDANVLPQTQYNNYTANRSTETAYNFGCANCHPVLSSNHMTGTVQITLFRREAGVGTLRFKNRSTAVGGLGVANSGITGTTKTNVVCSASYCHSNGNAAALVYAVTPNWYGGTFTGDRCANCHGNAPNSTITGSKAHYNNRFLGYTSYASGHQIGIHAMNIYSSSGGLAKAGASGRSSHGNSATATTISCNVCHYSTVTTARNDNNGVCKTCHVSGNTVGAQFGNPIAIANKAQHVNGLINVSFQPTPLRSKAQMRQSSFATAPYSSVWKRTAGYKLSGSYDTAKTALDTANMWDSSTKTCANVACHNGQSVKWSDTNGATNCISCHTSL